MDYIDEISPRPILFVVGDRTHSRFFSENAFKAAAEPKELYVVDDAEEIAKQMHDAEDEEGVDSRAVSGLEGWIACFEHAKLAQFLQVE